MMLYKYLTVEKATRWLIQEEVILLTPPKYLNDVVEARHLRVPHDENDMREMFLRFQSENPSLIGFDEWKASLRGDAFRSAEGEHMREGLSKVLGVVSLSADPINELMWAHYALNSGVAIGYRAGELKEHATIKGRDTAMGLALRVEYSDCALKLDKKFRNAAKLHTRKRVCWRYEKEWRIIDLLNTAKELPIEGKVYYGLPARKDRIKHMVFGVNSSAEFKRSLVEWLGKDSEAQIDMITIDPVRNEFHLEDNYV